MYNNQDFMNALQLVSFIIGWMNLQENLTQNDKADIMNRLDQQTKDILGKVEEALEKQNEMLKQILDVINREEN